MEIAARTAIGEVLPLRNTQQNDFTEHFAKILDEKSYVTIAGCALEHLIFSNALTNQEKIFMILTDCMASIELNSPKRSGKRQLRISATALATITGINKRTVLSYQSSLSEKEYLLVEKGGRDNKNRIQRNLLTPTLPEAVLLQLQQQPNREHTGSAVPDTLNTEWHARAELDAHKLFVRINFKLLQTVMLNPQLPASAKLLWLYIYMRSFIQFSNCDNLVFHITVPELAAKTKQSEKMVRESLNKLQQAKFIFFEDYKIDAQDSYRKEKRLLAIAACLPNDVLATINDTPNRKKISCTANSEVIGTKDHHESTFDHHQQPKRSPLCINNLHNKQLNIKNEEGEVNNPVNVTTMELDTSPVKASHVFTEKKIEQINSLDLKLQLAEQGAIIVSKELLNNPQVHELLDKFNKFKQQAEQNALGKSEMYQIASTAFTAIDQKLLSYAAHAMNLKINDLITQMQAKHPNMSFEQFLRQLPEYEQVLFAEQMEAQSCLFDKELLMQLTLQQQAQDEAISSTPTAAMETSNVPEHDHQQELEQQQVKTLGTNTMLHINNYIKKIHSSGDIKGYYANVPVQRLVFEAANFVINWQPTKQFASIREKRKFQLAVFAKKLREDKWRIPTACLAADRANIASNLLQQQDNYMDNLSGARKYVQ